MAKTPQLFGQEVQMVTEKDNPNGYAGLDANGKVKTSVLTSGGAQADSVAATVPALVTDFNALLAKLRSIGIIG